VCPREEKEKSVSFPSIPEGKVLHPPAALQSREREKAKSAPPDPKGCSRCVSPQGKRRKREGKQQGEGFSGKLHLLLGGEGGEVPISFFPGEGEKVTYEPSREEKETISIFI